MRCSAYLFKCPRWSIVEVKRQVVIGTQAVVDQVLAPYGWQISTAFIERLNLSLRQRVVGIRRRSASPVNLGFICREFGNYLSSLKYG
jgi:hypothetical protein